MAGGPVLARVHELTWDFPIARPHAGPLIGNGTQGLMIWGEGNRLIVTVGHNGFWDHRGGNDLEFLTTFQDVKRLLYAKDADGLKKQFSLNPAKVGRPRQIGGGDLVFAFPTEYRLTRATLDLSQGEVRLQLAGADGRAASVVIRQVIDAPLAWMELSPVLAVSGQTIPSWRFVRSTLEKEGIAPPLPWEAAGCQGFVQPLPADPALGVGYRLAGNRIVIASELDANPRAALLRRLQTEDFANHLAAKSRWWREYWAAVPEVSLPDPVLQEIFDFGLYKQACLTPPMAEAAGLQGPFNESYQLPPWSNDFHFNINVQMIYLPALASNRPEHLLPLWRMLLGWLPQFRQRGAKFYGREGALLFPHATDDRGQIIGQFWTGILDHACASWMADLAWKHYRYTLDQKVLAEVAWPLLTGAFETYWAIKEDVPDGRGGQRFSLPVSVSPEYGRAYSGYKRAWGRDASFQLAAWHRTARTLPKAAAVLGRPIDPRWREVETRLPPYTIIDDIWMLEDQLEAPRIALWEGQDLVGSHRHHSHLAGLFPFYTIDPKDKAHQEIAKNTIRNWVFKGSGNWMGWSYPWAAAIWSRLDSAESSVRWLHYWYENFVNEGRSSLAFSPFPGQTLLTDAPVKDGARPTLSDRMQLDGVSLDQAIAALNEKMQMDAAMSALTAVFELLVQDRERDTIAVLPSIPQRWRRFSFRDVRAEGAFLISAVAEQGQTRKITVKCPQGGRLRLEHGLGRSFNLNGASVTAAPSVLEYTSTPGEVVVLERPARD